MKLLRALVVVAALAGGAASAQTAASAPAPALPTTTPGSQAILLGLDRVRQELGLTSLQKAVLNDIRLDYRDAARAIVAKAGRDAASKTAAQRQLDALTARSNLRAERVLNDSQRARFEKLERQYLGAFALLDPEIQEQLALTPKQQTKLAHVWHHYQGHVSAANAAYENGELSHNQRIVELRDIRYDASDDLLERLTKPQLTKFNELTARPSQG